MFSHVFLFLNLGTPEIMLIAFVALLLFGGKKLPELARGLGKGIRDFKEASDGLKTEIHNQINTIEQPIASVKEEILKPEEAPKIEASAEKAVPEAQPESVDNPYYETVYNETNYESGYDESAYNDYTEPASIPQNAEPEINPIPPVAAVASGKKLKSQKS